MKRNTKKVASSQKQERILGFAKAHELSEQEIARVSGAEPGDWGWCQSLPWIDDKAH